MFEATGTEWVRLDNAWEELRRLAYESGHPCVCSTFCRWVKAWRRRYSQQYSAYPLYYHSPDTPAVGSAHFVNDIKWHDGGYKAIEYVKNLMGKPTKATDKNTFELLSMSWPLWRDSPSGGIATLEDLQVILWYLEQFKDCKVTKGTNESHKIEIRRIQREYLSKFWPELKTSLYRP